MIQSRDLADLATGTSTLGSRSGFVLCILIRLECCNLGHCRRPKSSEILVPSNLSFRQISLLTATVSHLSSGAAPVALGFESLKGSKREEKFHISFAD